MALGGVIIIMYVMMWISGYGKIYDFDKSFVSNLGSNAILIIGILMFCEDLKTTLNKRKKNAQQNKKEYITDNLKKTENIDKTNNGIKKYLFYLILTISIFMNVLLFASLILMNNNVNELKEKYDILEKEKSQMCKWHLHLTENGAIKECD